MGRAVSGGPECARCGHDLAEVHLTAIGVEFDVPITDGKYSLNPALVEEADIIQVEAVCQNCGHVRYIEQNDWEWA
jgi:hypothetical protein